MQRTIFDEEHNAFRDSVRRFMQSQVAPYAERWRREGCVEREIWRKGGEQGLLCIWADEEFGGAGVEDFRYEQILAEENIRHGDIGLFYCLHSRIVAPYIGLNNPRTAVIFGGLMGTSSGVAGGLAATDPKLVPYGCLTAAFYTAIGCLLGPSLLYFSVRGLVG